MNDELSEEIFNKLRVIGNKINVIKNSDDVLIHINDQLDEINELLNKQQIDEIKVSYVEKDLLKERIIAKRLFIQYYILNIILSYDIDAINDL